MPPTVIGVPGNSARIMGWADRLAFPVTFVMMLMVASPLLTRGDSLLANVTVYVTAVGLGAAIGGKASLELFRASRKSKHWLKGAEGESLTGAELDKLPEGYIVFHDYHLAGADGEPVDWNIDHVVIGPTGAFVVESKNYSSHRIKPANSDPTTRKNVKQTQRTAAEFKKALVTWSGGQLANLFVVPLLVYTQPGAYIEQTQEKQVKVIPLKWLTGSITSWKGHSLDPDKTYRIARVLFSQLRSDLKNDFQGTLDLFGERSKRYKLQRADERWQQRMAVNPSPPVVCPECGGALVNRVANRGDREGKRFLGCENYYASKKCRYIFNLEESA